MADHSMPPDYDPADDRDRRKRISKAGDGGKAITEAMGVLYSLKSLGQVLTQDTIRCNDAWVLAIGESILEQAAMMIEFLDRPGGWPELDDDEPEPQSQHDEIVAEIRAEHPYADDREQELRVIIREHIAVAMSPHEEDETYERLSKVWPK